ncbi:MAG: Urocanate hydratase, partial [uncultured Thermoleophilia bacterium]
PAAVDGRRPGEGRVPGPAGPHLLARVRGAPSSRSRDQRARPLRRGHGADRHRPRPPRLRLGRLAVPGDRGHARRLRRDRGLADPERDAERGLRRRLGGRPPRRRRRHRPLHPRRGPGGGRRYRRRGAPSGACAHERPRHGRDAPRERGLRHRDRDGARARPRPAGPDHV